MRLSRSRHDRGGDWSRRRSLLRSRRAWWNADGACIGSLEASVAWLGVDLAVTVCLVLFAAAARSRSLGLTIDLDLWWCLPAWNLPDGAGEGLEGERALGPLAAWSTRAIEGAEACIDGSLIRLRSALRRGLDDCAIGGSILTIDKVSNRSMEAYGQIS